MKKTRFALFQSIICLMLCFSMLVGTTFAWFTDTVTSKQNVIAAGDLDVELEYWADGKWNPVTETTNVFDPNTLWEPGHTEVVYLRLSNAGSLALNYRFGVNIVSEQGSVNQAGDPFKLSQFIRFGALESTTQVTYATREQARSALTESFPLADAYTDADPLYPVNNPDGLPTEKFVTLVVYMPEDVKNEANYATGAAVPKINLGIQLVATQQTYEDDSFGTDYDTESQMPEFPFPVGGIADSATGSVTTDDDGKVDQTVTLQGSQTSATIPTGVQLEQGTSELTLTVNSMAQTGSNLQLEENQEMTSLNVHVAGVATDNTVPMVIQLVGVLPVGLNQGNYALHHVENGVTNPMTAVATAAEVDAHNEFYYDPATGNVTVALASFSEIAMTAISENPWNGTIATAFSGGTGTEEDPYIIANADQLAYFGAVVGGMMGCTQDSFEDKHIKLIADINLGDDEENNNSSIIFYPIGYWNSDETYEKTNTAISSGFYSFMGTFDGNGHTISNFYQNTWEMKGDHNWYDATLQYYRDGMGLFGRVYGGTVKNLTVRNFKSDGEITTTGVIAAYADFGATFENIAIFDCNPRVYNIGNGGIVGCVGWYTKDVYPSEEERDEYKVTFKNITVDNSNKISALWGSYDVACGGIVGQYYPTSGQSSANYPVNAGIHFENCHISAVMDVYNDVCANYQYYAYRYTGMLIGSVRENVTDKETGHVYPNMTGITASGCTVHFGDWNDYYYCELVANSLASYTHDHQMSRLEQVASVDVEKMEVTSLKGETTAIPTSGRVNYVVVKAKDTNGMWIHGDGHDYAECYHFVNGVQHFHDVADADNPNPTETVNGVAGVLKEDKQLIYREFNQLFTGYGWGVTSKGLTDFEGVENMDIEHTDQEGSVEKFEGKVTELSNNKEYKLGDIFKFVDNGVKLVPASLMVSVNNLDENNPVSATFVRDSENWENGTLTLTGTGKVQITIQDYYFCTPTTITVTITEREAEEKFDIVMNNGDFLHRVGNVGTVALDKLFKAKNGAKIGTVSVTVETVTGASGTYTSNATWQNGTIQFSGTGVVKVTITDNDYCIPTELILEVVDATNVTGLFGTISGNVVLLNDCGLSSLTVSGRNTVYGNGFTATYSGNGQYLNNGLKQGVVTVSENGTLDNLRIKASIYPAAYMYYGKTTVGEYVQGGPSSVEGDKTRYHYQLSAVAASGNATIQNCYIFGGRNNIFINTGDVTIKDTILECAPVANVQIQSNSSHTITFENVTTIQYQAKATIGDTSKVMLGAAIVVGPETNGNPNIVLNGDFKQYNWVNSDDAGAVSSDTTKMIIQAAVAESSYNHTINGETASNLGIIYMNDYEKTADAAKEKISNNTGLPYVFGAVTIKYAGSNVEGRVYSLQGASENQIYSDCDNADRTTVNGLYQPQFKYDSELGGQHVPEGGDEHCYREGDTIHVMFPSGDTKELDLAALVNIVKYSEQNLNLQVTCKDGDGNAVTVNGGKVALSTASEYIATYTVTDTLFYDENGKKVTKTIEYSWDVTVSVSLKDAAVPNAYFEFDASKQIMGYAKQYTYFGDNVQYLPFLAGLKIYDYVGQEVYLRFDGDSVDNGFNRVAKVEITGYTSANHVLIKVTLTDGGVIDIDTTARAVSGGSTYTGSIKTSGNVIYYVNGGTTGATTTTWVISGYTFTGNNGVEVDSGSVTFANCVSENSAPSGSFGTDIKYTVTYDANEGNCGQTVGYATSVATAVTLPTATRSGYIFAGWYTAASGGTRVGGAGENYTPSANITLYAQWGKPCTVTYNANGGSCGTASEKYTDTALTLPTPTRDGYWFIGWYDAAEGGNKIGDAGATYNPSGEITLYAHWQKKVEYTVTYNANEGTCGTASATYQGTALTLPTPTRTGYKFLGWYTATSGGTKVGDAGASYTPSANITLYAQWEQISYTITISKQNNATVTVDKTTAHYNDTISVTVSFSQSSNKTLTVKDASGNTVLSKSAAGTYTFTMPASNVTIEASSSSNSCVTGDTLVTLADGKQKRIDEVSYDDQLLVWDFYKGEYAVAPALLLVNYGTEMTDVLTLTFSDGTHVRVVGEHGFFDQNVNKYVYIDADDVKDYLGHQFAKMDGKTYTSVELVAYEITTEYVGVYSILTENHHNAIVEGMLSVTPAIYNDYFFSPYEVGEDMKYDAVALQADIEQYGLYEYELFEEYVTYEEFIGMNIDKLKAAVGKGLITYEEIVETLKLFRIYANK